MSRRSRQAEYERLNGKYLREAEELITKKDYPQASEKLWGAYAEMVKAVAAKRGVGLGTHRSIAEFVEKLEDEHPEWKLTDGLAHAERLHVNFYEDHLPGEQVKRSAQAIRGFVEKLRGLL